MTEAREPYRPDAQAETTYTTGQMSDNLDFRQTLEELNRLRLSCPVALPDNRAYEVALHEAGLLALKVLELKECIRDLYDYIQEPLGNGNKRARGERLARKLKAVK